MRATVDTNVFVSALNFGGVPERLLELLDEGQFVLCISPALIAELRRVLADRFGWNEDLFRELLNPILAIAEMAEPAFVLDAVDDPDDNRILECAVESKSDVIVTGDDHLLRLGTFQGIPIVTPRDFVESLSGGTKRP
jgi:putative PIN family toxin of toxin-antitoxin system